MGKEEFGLTVLLPAIVWKRGLPIFLRQSTQDSVFGKQQVQDDLCIKGPVARVVENKNGINFKRSGNV